MLFISHGDVSMLVFDTSMTDKDLIRNEVTMEWARSKTDILNSSACTRNSKVNDSI